MKTKFIFLTTFLFLFCFIISSRAQTAGDLCDSAISITVGASCTFSNYTSIGATNSGSPLPSCGSFQGADVWFKIVVPASGKLQIRVTGSGSTANWSVYSGTCASLMQLQCNSNYGYYNINSLSLATQTIRIRVWRSASAAGGNFSICAWEPNTAPNDFCANAISLPVNTSCIMQNLTSIGCTAEATSVASNPSCGAYQGGDIWFKVTIPASGGLRIEKANNGGINAQSAIYSGSCGAFTQLACLTANDPFNYNNIANAGQTLYIRVWNVSSPFEGGTFTLCASETLPPVNDNCINAITIPVNSTCQKDTFSSFASTAEATTVAANPTCGIYLGGDVWFKAQVPASGKIRFETYNVSGINAYSALYSGSCGAFTQLGCWSTSDQLNINNIALAGQFVYLRVWNFLEAFDGGNFSVCAIEPNTPANDFCANAITLPVHTSCMLDTFNNHGCTAEAISVATNPTCGIFQGGDVWFKLVMPASGKLRIQNTNIAFFNAHGAIYSGTCGAFTSLGCWQGNNGINLNNISLAGQTLYIRIWSFNNATSGGSFGICAFEPNIPINDFCANAILLSVNPSCQTSTYNNIACTAESVSVSPSPTCGLYIGADVWFKVVVPVSGKLRVETSNISITPCGAIYSGTCGAMTQLGCWIGNNGYNINQPALAGQTLYIRVWNYNDAALGGSFNICAWDPNTAANDFCANAALLNVSTSCMPLALSNIGSTSEALTVAANPSCGFYEGSDMWYKVVMPASGHLRIETSSSTLSISFAVYTGTCGNFSEIKCVQLKSYANIHNHALAGQTLYIRVFEFSNANKGGSFTICVWEPNTLENDFCANATTLTLGTSCISNTYSTIGCTAEASSVAPNPTCGFYEGGDIWFKFIMPNSGLLTIQKNNGVGMNVILSLFTGTCGNMTELLCVQNNNTLTLNNISLAGQQIHLRVFNYSSDDGGSFSFCAYDPTCLVSIDSVIANSTVCSNLNTGSIQVYASCALCTGSLEYSLNNGTYQSSPVFSNLGLNNYQIKVRDAGAPNCIQTWPNLATVTAQNNAITYYQDLDNDGYGNNNVSIATCNTPPANYIVTHGDCNDNNNQIHPGITEIRCNNLDENCNGLIDDKPVEIEVSGNCNVINDGDLSVNTTGIDATYFGAVTLSTSLTQQFVISNKGTASMLLSAINKSGTQAASFVLSGFAPNTIIQPNQSITISITFTPNTIGTHNAVLTILNDDCEENSYDFAISGIGTNTTYLPVQLKLFYEAYYVGASTMLPVLANQGIITCNTNTDSISVELRHATSLAIVASSINVVKTDGTSNCRFAAPTGNYYISIKHRNGLNTWSSAPIAIGSNGIFYDFTNAANKAYGNNMLEVESNIWAFYQGDLNQDENIDLIDLGLQELDINNFENGYRAADINGDGNVDLLDSQTVENNTSNFVFSIHP